MTDKLTKAQREQIIFSHLKGEPDPRYTVEQTKYGKWIVKAKPVEIEEEEEAEPELPRPQTPTPQPDSNQSRRERRKRNRRAKQDAKRILDALTNLINGNNNADSSDEDDDERPRAPPLVEQPQLQPQQISFRRRRLAF